MTDSIKNSFALVAIVVLIVATLLSLTAKANAMPSEAAAAAKPGSQKIAEIASSNPNFSTLVTALGCQNLVPLVSGKKQLTVFAPTNAAFSELGLDSSNVCSQANLGNILAYHVMSGRHTSNSVLARDNYRMLNGERLTKQELVDAGIASTNLSAKNGVIHVINSVLLP